MSTPALSVENLSKMFRIGLQTKSDGTMLSMLGDAIKAPFRNFKELRRLGNQGKGSTEEDNRDAFWALQDINFTLKQGEVLGVVGRNGAGKSTLLKILSRITEPTKGRVVVHGRVGSLLEVGTGFHPDLTGRENVYLNGTILGMKKREIDERFDMIVDFSGISKFIDTPVKRYSSGMRVRLAFSVAAYLNPEILIIDEVLAVGDADFQKQCLGRMEQVASQGRTVIFVSHNMGAVNRLCTRAIGLVAGKIAIQGAPSDVISAHLSGKAEAEKKHEMMELELGPVVLRGVRVLQGSLTTRAPRCEEPLAVEISFSLRVATERLLMGFEIVDFEGNVVFRVYDESEVGLGSRASGGYRSCCRIPANLFQPKTHYLRLIVGIHREGWLGRNICEVQLDFHSENRNDVDYIGIVRPKVDWEVARE
jgi:lipopolysaccharide transport system ATP-binding protein